MNQNTKNISLLFFGGSLLALVLLAASLANLQLQPGSPIPGGGHPGNFNQTGNMLPLLKTSISPILQGIAAIVFIMIVILFTARLIAFVNFMYILRLVLVIAVLVAVVYFLPQISSGQRAYIPNAPSEVSTQPDFNYSVTPLEQPPQILIRLVLAAIVFGISLTFLKNIAHWRRKTQPDDALIQEAQNAVDAIQSGVDLKNVILHCYAQMTRALYREQGIERQDNMTAREFERQLEIKGFPPTPVHQLTALFEKVRYGAQKTSAQDEKTAMDCLNEIIQYCRSGSASGNG